MGEQPRPVEDEVERALSSMRASFLAGSEQIATGIVSLEEHFAGAPENERGAVAAAVARLVATHERLTSKVAYLPSSGWDSFKIMVSAVKAQQAVLDQVSHLVQEHVLPRQLESLQATPFAAVLPQNDDPPPPVSVSFIPDDVGSFRDHDGDGGDAQPLFADGGFLGPNSSRGDDPLPDDGGFRDGSGYRGEGSVRSPAGLPGGAYPVAAEHAGAQRAGVPQGVSQRAPPHVGPRRDGSGFGALAGLRRADEADEEPERRSLFALARQRMAGFRGLAAMVIVGVLLSVLPRDMQLQEMTARLIELVGPGGDATVADELPPPSRVAAATEPRSTERVPPAPDGDAATDEEPAAAPPQSKQTSVAPSRRATAAATKAPVQPRPKRIAAALPAAAPAEKQYVPVVFTHKDKATVRRAMSDLKAQYPNVLIGRRGEIVPVDLGKKGIWHRLMVLPAGPRPEATKVCEELAAEGYDLCWVKAY